PGFLEIGPADDLDHLGIELVDDQLGGRGRRHRAEPSRRGASMAFTSWRGVLGCVKPTMRPGGLEELIRMLPEGIGVIPLFLGIREGTTDEFKRAIAPYEPLLAQLAEVGCDLIHPEGAPPFMLLGHKGEAELLKKWERKYKVPMFTSGRD